MPMTVLVSQYFTIVLPDLWINRVEGKLGAGTRDEMSWFQPEVTFPVSGMWSVVSSTRVPHRSVWGSLFHRTLDS